MGAVIQNGYGQTFTFSTVAGGTQGSNDGVNGAAQFYNPTGMTVDGAGNLYVADQLNNAIRKIAPSGTNWTVTTIAGGTGGSLDGTNLHAQFFGPTGIAMDSATNLYVADQFNDTIRKISPAGTNWVVSTIAGQAGVTGANNGTNNHARFYNPGAIALDESGNIFVADEFNNAIRKIAPSGSNWIVSTIAGGTAGSSDGTNGAAQFFAPAGVAVDGNDRVFVADQFNNTIRLITPVGSNWVVTTIAGQLDSGSGNGLGTAAQFTSPVGLALDASGNVYVADLFDDAIRKMSPVGTNWLVSTIGGGSEGFVNGVGTNAQFFLPFGVATDSYGDVFVADSGNNAIRLGVSSSGAPPVGNIFVTLTPTNAVAAGAEWQLDGGPYQTNGATLSALTPGVHALGFNNIAGFTTPAWQTVTVTAHQTTTATANYATAIANAGSLQVFMAPATVVQAGAQWSVDSGPLETNGAVVAGLTVGTHTLSFSAVNGWSAPAAQVIAITNSRTTLGEGTYVLQTGSLQVTLMPPAIVNGGAKWQVDGGTFQNSGATVSGLLPGLHAIAFNTVLGWSTPAYVTLSVAVNQTTATVGMYSPAPPRLSGLAISNGAAHFVLNGLPGCLWVIQSSSNLVNWTAIATNTISASGTVSITNGLPAGQTRIFYRAAIVSAITPTLTGFSLSAGKTQMTLNGSVGGTYIIQASSNLVNWSAVSTNVLPASGAQPFAELMQTNIPARFYRAAAYY